MKINNTKISTNSPTYFIADIASSHDGDVERAKDLIYLCESELTVQNFNIFSRQNSIRLWL